MNDTDPPRATITRIDIAAAILKPSEFCDLFDNPAFDPKCETLPMSEFEPMVRRVFAQPKNSLYLASTTVSGANAATV